MTHASNKNKQLYRAIRETTVLTVIMHPIETKCHSFLFACSKILTVLVAKSCNITKQETKVMQLIKLHQSYNRLLHKSKPEIDFFLIEY